MADELDRLTDKELEKLEKQLHRLYKEASESMQETIDNYFLDFAKRDAQMKATMEAGEITKEQYTQWRIAQIGRGKRFEALRDKLAERMTKANEVAAAYVNDVTPGVYTLNMNYTAYEIEQGYGSIGFTIWDDETVRRLALEEPELMPYYPEKLAVKRGIDLAYGAKQITAQVTSSILLGDSVYDIADKLQTRIEDMGRTSAVRTARTAFTAAQNGGRQASYERAAQMGIKVRKRWIATKDMRTRHEHGAADGQTVAYDEPFTVGGEKLMFPGDRTAASGWNIYNCRCTTRTVEKDGIEAEPRMMRVRDPVTGRNELAQEMTYGEWLKLKTAEGKMISEHEKTALVGKAAVDVNKDYIATQRYRMKYHGITKKSNVDDAICKYSREMLDKKTGTTEEMLTLLDMDTGKLIYQKDSTAKQKVQYSAALEEAIKAAQLKGQNILAIHNHPYGYPPTADDCVSAAIHGYALGVICGHNGNVYTYEPATRNYTVKECEAIHNAISMQLIDSKDIDNVWLEMLKLYKLKAKAR